MYKLNYPKIKGIFLLISAAVFLGSCSIGKFVGYYASAGSGDKGKLDGQVYTSDSTSYRIGSLPDGWKRIDIEGGDLAFSNPSNDSTITVNSTCDERKMKYSLKALSESLIVGVKDKKAESRQETQIDGQPALMTVYTGSLNNTPVKIETRVFKMNNCVYDFTYASSPARFDTGAQVFNEFISQFRVL
ncbi:MAG: hypothetical protein AB1598_11060 [Thermodesulfobacteriota bacterium]